MFLKTNSTTYFKTIRKAIPSLSYIGLVRHNAAIVKEMGKQFQKLKMFPGLI